MMSVEPIQKIYKKQKIKDNNRTENIGATTTSTVFFLDVSINLALK